MSDGFTTDELANMRAIPSDRADAAVEAYLANPKAEPFALGNGYVLDLDATVMAHAYARQVLGWPDTSDALKRAVVRKAILAAQPLKA